MKRLFFVAMLAAIIPLPVTAASGTPGFTAYDQQQFAKLKAQVGTWTCKNTPASKNADVVVTKQQGNYFVGRETGDTPNTSYTRWSHSLRQYYTVSLFDSGASSVFNTTASDPNNATWNPAWPMMTGVNRNYPATLRTMGNTYTVTGQYADAKGVHNFKSVCTKQ
ncbi:MAG TPA: hypothetical protein VFE17_03845 [Candidatus Baltobacteraceae bacterium]|jgi:hypothetical protein|nr:hypothetical protein [Candidatus Baltobacteraceae bacterium]